MQVIRLQRVGKKNQPSFRIVLQERSWAPQGKAQELLGFYDPVNKEKTFQEERISYWVSRGARPSPTVHNLLVDAGVLEGGKVQAWRPKVKVASEEEKLEEDTKDEPTKGEEKKESEPEQAKEDEEVKSKAEPEEKDKSSTEEKPAPAPAGSVSEASASEEAAPDEQEEKDIPKPKQEKGEAGKNAE